MKEIEIEKSILKKLLLFVVMLTLGIALFGVSFWVLSPVFGDKQEYRVIRGEIDKDTHSAEIEVEIWMKNGFKLKATGMNIYLSYYDSDNVKHTYVRSDSIALKEPSNYYRFVRNVAYIDSKIEMIDVEVSSAGKIIGYSRYIIPTLILWAVSVLLITLSGIYLNKYGKIIKSDNVSHTQVEVSDEKNDDNHDSVVI